MMKRRYPYSAAWFASAALLISGACAHAQAPIIDASQPYGRGYSSAPAASAPAPAGQGGELLLQVQALQQEVMQLRGIVEEQAHQIEALKQQGLDRYIDLDRRISQLGGGAAASGGAIGGASAGALANEVPVQPGPGAAAAPGLVGEGSAGAAALSSAEPAQSNEYDAYKQAYAKVKEQNFPAAIQSFQAFIAAHPNSTLTPNAYYWLGELYLQTPQDLNAAERAFTKVVDDFPQHSKAPDSLYKLGRVHYMKGDRAKAQSALQQVIDEYGASGSAAPQLAKQFLDQNFN